jgi:hypothetical protein
MATQIIRQQILLAAFAIMLVLTVAAAQAAQAETFKVLYDFTGGVDGSQATGGLAWDTQGNLYGVTASGGTADYGTAFELSKQGSSWVFDPLHSFKGGNDGSEPLAPLVLGPDQTFYGTTSGVAQIQPGTVFNLVPGSPPTTLYSFTGGIDGDNPMGALVFDNLGNLYGTTTNGVTSCGGPMCGNVYQLMPSGSGWIETPLYTFTGGSDGGQQFGHCRTTSLKWLWPTSTRSQVFFARCSKKISSTYPRAVADARQGLRWTFAAGQSKTWGLSTPAVTRSKRLSNWSRHAIT